MSSTCRIGLLTPSSNTIMEPRVSQILADTPGTTAHFARFRVVKIAMSDEALGQFSFVPQLEAAEHLVDAKCDVIAWGGTSGGWLGADNIGWGRPVDVLGMPDGALRVSDDRMGVIYRIRYAEPSAP